MNKYRGPTINLKQYAPYTLRTVYTQSSKKQIEESYKVLNISPDSNQDVIRQAFIELAKKYHPDSQSPDADIDKFVAVEDAFRLLSKHKSVSSKNEEVEKIIFDIKHTAPQHRQYLSFEGVGHGTPFQREKQWHQVRAQKAANNVLEHRVSKAITSENTLIKKESLKKHDIKTKYGLERLVEDLIQESMSKGEFENLSGKGKPLKDQNTNPYVDFTTHKLNESNKDLAKSINTKINTYNLIVPLLNKQKFHVEFDEMCEDILKNGLHSVIKDEDIKKQPTGQALDKDDDIIGVFFKAVSELFTFNPQKR
ncbi:unnamed protein product [Leptidea sinapis]|uniref:J domain-containing protein n=1 Tax=Leptidea sinapis TaxID=189913 RepID=A0A5E4R7C9_9NEOP|nr:unnamed protein product [Leptidea sinapis]